MLLALALLLADATCDVAKKKQAAILSEVEPWLALHRAECTLCADGSSCREGFQRRSAARLAFEAWRDEHAVGCDVCVSKRCLDSEQQSTALLAEAKVKHRARCAKCPFDPALCEGWRTATVDAQAKFEAWKRDHAGGCDKCAPPCADWARRLKEHAQRAEDALLRHRERCGDCKVDACDRAAQIKQDAHHQRLTLWRSHVESCPCVRRR